MHLQGKRRGARIEPLERVTLVGATRGIVSVKDSLGREYVRQPAQPEIAFTVGGALGYHTVTLEHDGQTEAQLTLCVGARTRVADEGGQFAELLQMLCYTMTRDQEQGLIRYRGRLYRFFVRWLRDHVHVLKGMKYFAATLKDGIDLYRDSQREDGMIWDNVYPREPPGHDPNHWSVRFDYDDFIRCFDDGSAELKRIPVENDVEYLFVEGLYYTWKAVGDDGWMSDAIDAAIRAMEYSVTNPYRWSEKYELLRRGYTIDTWDFQAEEDRLSDFVGWPDPMAVDVDKTRFGVMFGDNTGYAVACEYLAEMLEHIGRTEEAQTYRARGALIRERLDALSWNGQFFTHHVPEEESLVRDLGVDEKSQVSLSNAYSLNRRIAHEQCVAIVETYQRIRANLPPGSPGEWYTIYPPFERGFGGHSDKWQYMNGGVTPIVAGELAHGAFEHGAEAYAVDILRRLHALGVKYGRQFHCAYTGAFPPPPTRTFTPLAIAQNVQDADVQEMAGVPFRVGEITPDGCATSVGISQQAGHVAEVMIPVGAKAASVYFLHALERTDPGGIGGTIRLHYADGSTYTQYVVEGHNVLRWNHWQYLQAPNLRKSQPNSEIAWRGWHPQHLNVQVLAYGLDSPHPEREIERITLSASECSAVWRVFGVTLCDAPVYFPPSPISFGIPDNWGAAAVVYALIEGLVGVVDAGVAYDQVELSPRWAAAGTDQAEAVVHYPASGGYVAYRYRHDGQAHTIQVELTGSGETCRCHVLLPDGVASVSSVRAEGASGAETIGFEIVRVEGSHYADVNLALPGPRRIIIQYMR
jgi:hypothetical protein